MDNSDRKILLAVYGLWLLTLLGTISLSVEWLAWFNKCMTWLIFGITTVVMIIITIFYISNHKKYKEDEDSTERD